MHDARSPFAVRGVIEGFYGHPWTHEQRLDLIAFIARARDEHVRLRAQGRPARPPRLARAVRRRGALQRLRELVDAVPARRRRLRVLHLARASRSATRTTSDVDALCAKLDASRRSGSPLRAAPRRHPARAPARRGPAAFADLAAAHAALVARVATASRPARDLVVCPTVYWGTGDEPYLAALGAGHRPAHRPVLDRPRDLLADARPRRCRDVRARRPAARRPTGTTTRSTTWRWATSCTSGRTAAATRSCGARRPASSPTAWSSSRPRRSRSRPSPTTSRPRGLRPRGELASGAIRDVVGEADLEAFALFADNVRSSCLSEDDAPIVDARARALRVPRRPGRAGEAAAADLARRSRSGCCAAADHLLRGPVAQPALIDECRPWLEAFELGRAGHRAASPTWPPTGASRPTAPAELRPFLDRLRRRRVRVFGDVLEMTLSDLTGTHVPAGRGTLSCEGGGSMRQHRASTPGGAGRRGRARRRGRGGSAPAQRPRRCAIAMGSPGEAQIRVWDDVAAQFEAAHPGVDGRDELPGGRPVPDDRPAEPAGRPERAGHLLRVDRQRAWRSATPTATPPTSPRRSTTGPLAGIVRRRDAAGAPSTARSSMVPHTADVTNVLWYNVPLLARARRHAADDVGGAARGLRHAERRGRQPDRDGQQGPLGGRQLAQPPGLARRRRGRLRRDPRRRRASSPRPSGRQAFGYIAELRRARLRQRERQRDRRQRRRAAVLPGPGRHAPDRLVAGQLGHRRGPGPRVRLRQPAGDARRAAGDQGSVIGVETGYMVNAKSPNIDRAIEFLALLNSPENVQSLIGGRDHAARHVRVGAAGGRRPVGDR